MLLQLLVLKTVSVTKEDIEAYSLQKIAITATTYLKRIQTSVYELHIYDFLKFVLKAINSQHPQKLCNNLFTFKQFCVRVTRSSDLKLLEEPFRNGKQ